MTWFDDGSPTEYVDATNNLKVGLWPIKNSPRIDPRFRLINGEGKPAPQASHFFVRLQIQPAPTPVFKNCLIPLAAVADQKLEGSSGVSGDGFEFIFSIESFVVPDPDFDVWGFRYKLVYKHAGFPDFFMLQMVGTDVDAAKFNLNIKIDALTPTQQWGPSWFDTDYDPLVNTDVDMPIPLQAIKAWPLSECFVPQIAPEEGAAEFNGVDAWIGFDGYTDVHTQRFMLEFDIKLYDTGECVVLGPLFSSSKYVRFQQSSMSWRSSLITFSPILPLEEWMTIRVEFNWVFPTEKWKVYKDDVLIGENDTQGASGLQFNQMGRRGSIIQGVFDMRNLHYEDTDPAAPEVLLSTLLISDACDSGPKALKGTTVIMDLPSCP